MRNPSTITYQPYEPIKLKTTIRLSIDHAWCSVDIGDVDGLGKNMSNYLEFRKEMIEGSWKVNEYTLGSVLLAIYEKWDFTEGDGDGEPESD